MSDHDRVNEKLLHDASESLRSAYVALMQVVPRPEALTQSLMNVGKEVENLKRKDKP